MSRMFGEQRSLAVHKSAEWYTPAWVFDELGIEFHLDPCSPYDIKTAVPAAVKYTVYHDGLSRPWFGRVWLNPPYGPNTQFWIKRLIDHDDGIALVFSRTDAEWCQLAMKNASSILFLRGRIDFIPGRENQHKKSRAGAGSVMFSFGEGCADALGKLRARGFFIGNP